MNEQKAAVVTGGASGIGKATARQLLADGWCTTIVDLNDEAGEATLDQLGPGAADRLHFVRADVSREDDVARVASSSLEEFGTLDCWVNCAGFSGAFGAVTQLAVEDWDATFATLSRGTFLGIKHAALAMGSSGGAIVNVASIAGLSAGIGSQAYSASKAAVINLTQSAAVELAPRRIRVNAISPGMILTPLVDKVKNLEDGLRATQPWPDMPQPEPVAELICFLVSDRAELLTGANIVIDGGTMAAGPRLSTELGSDPGMLGIAGISYGNSGQKPIVRSRS